MLIFDHPIWKHVLPYAHLAPGRDNLDFLQLPEQLRTLSLDVISNCVACGKIVSPLRARQKSDRSRVSGTETERRLFYAPTCATEVNPGCSRSKAAQQHKDIMRAKLGFSTDAPDEIVGSAWIEDTYRYNLTRKWKGGEGTLLSMMQNPSTANAEDNDPTLLRNIHFAQAWGFGELVVVNPHALRSPSPKSLLEAADPVGPKCDEAIDAALDRASMYLVGWGRPPHDRLLPRIRAVEARLLKRARERGVPVVCLGLTQEGYPKHPLARGVHRVSDDQQPIPFKGTLVEEVATYDALCLKEPWLELILLGIKTLETRTKCMRKAPGQVVLASSTIDEAAWNDPLVGGLLSEAEAQRARDGLGKLRGLVQMGGFRPGKPGVENAAACIDIAYEGGVRWVSEVSDVRRIVELPTVRLRPTGETTEGASQGFFRVPKTAVTLMHKEFQTLLSRNER